MKLSYIIIVLFGVVLPWIFDHNHPVWPWIIATALLVWALISPSTLETLYNLWMKIGHGLGWMNTRLILGALYYAIVFPMGILMRLTRKDPMTRKFEKDIISYRIKLTNNIKTNIERPF